MIWQHCGGSTSSVLTHCQRGDTCKHWYFLLQLWVVQKNFQEKSAWHIGSYDHEKRKKAHLMGEVHITRKSKLIPVKKPGSDTTNGIKCTLKFTDVDKIYNLEQWFRNSTKTEQDIFLTRPVHERRHRSAERSQTRR